MTLRKWFYLFWTTLVLGTVAACATGLVLMGTYKDFSFMELTEPGLNGSTLIFMILGGATISLLSQMGFFSYMIIRFIAMGILRSRVRWDLLQLAVVIVVMIDTVYLRYSTFASNESWVGYALLPVLILLFALAISWWKVKLTNGGAFLSTLFFMFVATILEAVPALNLDSPPSYIFMLVPLLVCNAWQILILQKVLDNKKEPEAGSLAPPRTKRG